MICIVCALYLKNAIIKKKKKGKKSFMATFKSHYALCKNNEISGREIKQTIPFTIETKNKIKYLE